jgi:hypothetical protein
LILVVFKIYTFLIDRGNIGCPPDSHGGRYGKQRFLFKKDEGDVR